MRHTFGDILCPPCYVFHFICFTMMSSQVIVSVSLWWVHKRLCLFHHDEFTSDCVCFTTMSSQVIVSVSLWWVHKWLCVFHCDWVHKWLCLFHCDEFTSDLWTVSLVKLFTSHCVNSSLVMSSQVTCVSFTSETVHKWLVNCFTSDEFTSDLCLFHYDEFTSDCVCFTVKQFTSDLWTHH